MLGRRVSRVFRPAAEALDSRELMSAMTIEVTNTAGAGPGSLRRAINLSNEHPATESAPNVIKFAIPGTGVHPIYLHETMPVITTPVLINGYSQAGASVNTNPATSATSNNAKLPVELRSVAEGVKFIRVGPKGSDSKIRGLAFDLGAPTQVAISLVGAKDVSIEGNHIFRSRQNISGQFTAIEIVGGASNKIGRNPDGRNADTPDLQNVLNGYLVGISFKNGTTNNRIANNIFAERHRLFDLTFHESRGNAVTGNFFVGTAFIDDRGEHNFFKSNVWQGANFLFEPKRDQVS